MSLLQGQIVIKQEPNEQSMSCNSTDSTSNTKNIRSECEDSLVQNLDFAESLKLLAQNGRFASKKISVKTKFDKKATDVLKNWLIKNLDNPYPSDEVKDKLCEMTGLNKKQVQNWFTNTRKRYVQPLKRKIRNDMLSDGHSSEPGESQEDSQSSVKSEENAQKPQIASEKETNVTVTPQFSHTLVPNVYQVPQAVSAPVIILPGNFVLPGVERLSSPVFANVAQQSMQIPQVTYGNSYSPQNFLIDRNLLNIDENSFLEHKKETESREKLVRNIMINDSLKVALQVMRQEKLKVNGELLSGSMDEESQLRNKQRRQDLEAYLHQITKRVHVA